MAFVCVDAGGGFGFGEMIKRGIAQKSPLIEALATGASTQDEFVDTREEQIRILHNKKCDCHVGTQKTPRARLFPYWRTQHTDGVIFIPQSITLIERYSIRRYWVFAIRYWFSCVLHHVLHVSDDRDMRNEIYTFKPVRDTGSQIPLN